MEINFKKLCPTACWAIVSAIAIQPVLAMAGEISSGSQDPYVDKLLDLLQRQDNHYVNLIYVTAAVASVLAVVPTIIQWLLNRGSAARERKLEIVQDNISGSMKEVLAVYAESARIANNQSKQLFEATYTKTSQSLALINHLLAVTVRSTSAAAGTQLKMLKDEIEKLHSDCIKLIDSAKSLDDRGIITESQNQSRVRQLWRRILTIEPQITMYESLEGQIGNLRGENEARIVGDSKISLTPACLFVKGVAEHLENDFEPALHTWGDIDLKGADKKLSSDVCYWIGYERNNLGHYADAQKSFEKALPFCEDAFANEVKRIIIETEFFKIGKDPVSRDFIDRANTAMKAITDDPVAPIGRRNYAATTMGNILFCAASREGDKTIKHNHISSAKDWFDYAYRSSQNAWAAFGTCQCVELEGGTPDKDVIARIVLPKVLSEYSKRSEPRSRILAKQSELFCRRWLGDREEMSRVRNIIEGLLGDVDNQLTIYSQVRKQNVAKAEYIAELSDLDKRFGSAT